MERGKIVIVGAGLAGLSAAIRIAEIGKPVTLVDPHLDPEVPVPTDIRHTIPELIPETKERLGLLTESPLITQENNGVFLGRRRLADPPVVWIDALKARRGLLQRAKAHRKIELIEGRAIDLRTQDVRGEKRAVAVSLKDGSELKTGKDGLIVLASGIGTTTFSEDLFIQDSLPSTMNVLGAHITSPALRKQPRDMIRKGNPHGNYGVIVPIEEVEPNGTDFAAFFYVNKETVDSARGGSEQVLKRMQELTRRTRWARFFKKAKVDRVLYYHHERDVFRSPAVKGLVLVGDASAYLDPSGAGIVRIDEDTDTLAMCVKKTGDLTSAEEDFNDFKRQKFNYLIGSRLMP